MAVATRREERRDATVRQILAAATAAMAEAGVAGLSLSEVARRVGMQPPSLYQYFPSKMALYDALFAEGMQQCRAELVRAAPRARPPLERLRSRAEAFVRWGMVNPTLYQLLFWRPVPGFAPSATAMRASIGLLEDLREALADAVARGDLGPEAASEDAVALATAVTQGIVTQQLANEPGAAFEHGRFSRLTDTVIDQFIAHYTAPGGNP